MERRNAWGVRKRPLSREGSYKLHHGTRYESCRRLQMRQSRSDPPSSGLWFSLVGRAQAKQRVPRTRQREQTALASRGQIREAAGRRLPLSRGTEERGLQRAGPQKPRLHEEKTVSCESLSSDLKSPADWSSLTSKANARDKIFVLNSQAHRIPPPAEAPSSSTKAG